LKSNAATFGTTGLAAPCPELRGTRTGELSDGTQLLSRIEESYSATLAELATLRGRLAGT
jgi:hypothetical protein